MEKVKLGDICKILNGYAFKSGLYTESGLRIIRITNVQKGYIEDSEPKFYAIEKKAELSNYVLKENDLLISLTGNVGRVGLLQKEMLPAVLNQRVGCIRIKNESILNKKYLFNMLNNKMFECDCINNSKGIAQKNLSTEWLKEYKINLPNINEQEKMANKLDKVQDIIDIKTNQIEEINQLIKSQFVDMFGTKQDGFKCSKTEFNNCVINMLKGPFGSDIKKSLYVPKSSDTYKVYIQINAINKNQTLGDYWISKEYFDSKMFKFELKPKDYIATCDGTLGKLLRLDENMEKGIISASLLRITLDESVITPEYFENVWSLFMLDEMRKDIRNACLTHLPSSKVIGKIEVPLPSIEKQKEFSNIVKLLAKQKLEIQKSLEEVQKLQESLMNKYFG